MKKSLPNILLITLLALTFTAVFFAHPAFAADTSNGTGLFGIPTAASFVHEFMALIVNAALGATAYLVSIAGMLLNVSMVMTLHIRDFVNSTPAIYTIWQTIRDITGIFFIGFLLYAAFKMILNVESNYNKLVVDIVVAGILINFSFFLTSVAIDVSNVVSLAIYNAMLPNHPQVTITGKDAAGNGGTNLQTLTSVANQMTAAGGQTGGSGGEISDIFMQNLQIQTLYDAKGKNLGADITDPLKIFFIGVVGVIMMITTALSFVMAAAAFIVRLVFLLFLLAFSPLWFASWVIPDLKKYSAQFTEQLKNMLIFMPVYLLLMYAALRIMNESNLFGAGWSQSLTSNGVGNWAFGYVVLAINFAMVIVMLNLPLFVAMKMGGDALKFINTKKFGAQGIWNNVGRWTGSQLGSRTMGRIAYSFGNSRAAKYISSQSPGIGNAVVSGISKVGNAGFGMKKGGYEERLKATKKAAEATHKRIGSIDRSAYATEASYLEAKSNAEAMQAQYRENIVKPGGVMGFLLDNRANRQAAFDMNDEAMVGKNKKMMEENEKRIKELDDIRDTTKPGHRPLTLEEDDELINLRNANTELDASIKRGSGSKKKKDTSAAIKQLVDESKDDGDKPNNKSGESKPEKS